MSKVWSIAAVFAAAARVACAQVSTDIIRGRVTDFESHPVEGVDVRASSYQGQVTKVATTDKGGRFTIVFINGEGDYWIEMRKLGFQRKRFEVKKLGDEEVLIADARLSSAIVALDAVNVTGQRERALPNRNAKDADVGGGDKPLTNSDLSPDQAGNLAAMAAAAGFQLVPGLNGAPDMYSVLGLSGDQNNLTFNGLGSGISALPPDVLATTSINAYPFDVSKGGFSGAQIAIQTIPGSNFSRRSITNADIAPSLEWGDQAAAAVGGKYTNMRVGGNAAGPIAIDQVFYNTAYNVGRRFKDAQSLVGASALGLSTAGVASDSVQRMLALLGQQGFSPTLGGVFSDQTQDVAQGLVNLDIMPSASGTGHSFTVGAAGDYRRSRPVDRGALLLTTPSHGDETTFWGLNGSVVHTNYFWFGVLSKTTLGIAAQSTTIDPVTRIPEGIVRVNSVLGDGGSSVRSLLFGGNSLRSASSSRTLQVSNQLSWFSLDNTHTIRVTSSVAQDRFSSDLSEGMNGTYQFNSLADLAANAASSFSRTFSSTTQSGSQVVGALAVGDYWRPRPEVQVQYGVRVDGNHFLSAPSANPAVQTAFAVPNDLLPNRVYVSPRIGMQWAYGKSAEIAYAPGAARPPQAVVHAGIGVFQNVALSQFAASAMGATGLPSSARTINCVGMAVPMADWEGFLTDVGSIPTTCADGSSNSVFAAASPNVTLFTPGFREPRSLRAAADWSGPVLDNRFVLGLQGIFSNGLHQPGGVDLNVQRVPRFTIASENQRPMYVDPNAIVAGTGAIAAGAGKVSPAFQRVWAMQSDLGNHSRTATVNVKPITASPWLQWDLTYSWLEVREQYYGFSSTTGDPFATQWGGQPRAPKHTVDLRWTNVPLFDLFYVTTVVRAQSGVRFTPMVASDVNGDGAINDRAFIFDPRSTDPAGAAIGTLLASGSAAARACLERQVGELAARGSCQAPWTLANALQIKFNPRKIGLPKRTTVALTVANPLGIVDLAVHGSSDLRGWGQNIPPDENLLFVRGFDPATRRYVYDVNQRFGSTRPSESVARALPFMSLSLTIDLGVPRERQLLSQRLDAGRGRPGNRADAQSMKDFGTSAIPNPMAMLLTQQRDLGMTRAQADSLATLSRIFSVFADSVWTPVASKFERLPEAYSHGEAYADYVSARERTVDYLLTLIPHANGLLTAAQRRRIPRQIANYLDRRVLEFLRSSTLGDASTVAR
ncbi:MAG TPA: carboxypeptidase-like regulatory domain-containing protein [Gemmatimonadaceae bacterium]